MAEMALHVSDDEKAAFAKKPETIADVASERPMTGQEYLDSLRDDRAVYIYGERVKDITEHPAFRNTSRMLARFYDALHDPARKDKLTVWVVLDWALVAVSLICVAYIWVNLTAIFERQGDWLPSDRVISIIGTLLVLKRAAG